MQLHPYFRFNGQCREALTFYQACFGGELKVLTIGESPAAAHLPPAVHAQIMHATLTTEHFVLLGSDMGPDAVVEGNSTALFVECASEAETTRLFAALAAGGKITDPLGAKFWGGLFGVCVDRFGREWRLSYDHR